MFVYLTKHVHVHAQMSLTETYVYQITINNFTTDVYRMLITVGPPCLFKQGATNAVITDIAGVLTLRLGLMLITVITKVINILSGYQNKTLLTLSQLGRYFNCLKVAQSSIHSILEQI